MKQLIRQSRCCARAFLAALVIGLAGEAANAAVTMIGTQYRVDQLFPEFDCYWNFWADPSGCPTNRAGATVHVYVKNTGASSVTIDDATIAGYSLKTVIKMSTANFNPDQQNSIYFYWDNPPQAILDAGEPVWWKAEPSTIPVGGVAQVTVRLRQVPTNPVNFGVVTSSGTLTTNLTVDANAPRVASIGYSEDLKQIYIHWWRRNGAAPASVWMDGTDVSSLTTTVGDPGMNFAASVINLPNPLPFFSYHVYKGVYGDGKTATASQRAWTNKFIYTTWSTFEESSGYDASDWLNEAAQHGFNNIECNLGAMGSLLGTVAGRNQCKQLGYGYTILDKTKLQSSMDPDLWFINDEPDAEENNQSRTHCGTGYKIPCDTWKYAGTLVIKEAVNFAAELHALRANVPITVNLDGGLQPQSYYTWGPAVDSLESNNYYEVRLRDAYTSQPERIYLHKQPKLSYAVARTGTAGGEPNPFRHILYSCKGVDPDWPYPFPASKRMEAYYSLAGGSKGIGYWWFNPPRGLNRSAECATLWKEMGLIGNEIKTARNLIVRSTPVDLPLAPSANVWARAVASGVDTLILYVVNDNYANDISGCHVTNVPNATVTATLPAWMTTSPNAFEISASGLKDVSTVLNGSQLQLNLGTLTLTRMIVLTTDPTLRTAIQARYDSLVKPNVCGFAPEQCVNYPPSIAQQPSSQTVAPGGIAHFTLVPGGTSPLGYQWRKNNVNLSDAGHYSGSRTVTLTISGADSNDAASYRCVVTNAYGSITSSPAALTVASVPYPPAITQQPSNQVALLGGTATFTVAATGLEPLAYQWQKNNGNLSNGGHYSGSTNPVLTIATADDNDAASYRCVVTNTHGTATSASATLTIDRCIPSILLGHGDMEDATTYSVCPDWESYTAGFNSDKASWAKDTTTIHGGLASQRCRIQTSGAGSLVGVRQTVDANVGDAFTFEGWVNPVSNPGAGQQVAMVVSWDGSTANPATGSGSWLISTGARNVWTHLQNLAGNATGTAVTLFLDSRRTASSQDLAAYWDDVVSYRAYVPPPPFVSGAGNTSLNVDVDPGCNSENSAAQFAISVGGGAYTLGTHWVQTEGAVGTTAVWQPAAAWAVKTVTGLATGTPYTFKVQARYSSTNPQPTTLGAGATGTPVGSLPPVITQQPSAQSVCPSDTAAFSVAANGDGTITYQWQKNSVNLSDDGHYSGVTTTTLTVSAVDASDAASYRCVVSNPSGSTNSSEAGLTLKAATTITGAPLGQTVRPGANATFNVTAMGAGTLTYQWQTNGANIYDGSHYGGCMTATLTVINAGSADEVSYRCLVTGDCGTATSSEGDLVLATNTVGLVTLSTIPALPGDTANDARAITPDGRWVVGLSGSRGFLYAASTTNVFNAVSSDGAQATLLSGVGYRTDSGQQQIVMSGLAGGLFTAWMTADGGATWGAKAQGGSGKNPTVPMANGLAGGGSDVFYSVWTDEGAGDSDNWGLNVGRFSNSWPASVTWGPKSVGKPDTTQMNGVSGDGRAVGWRRNGTTLVYANYVADWQGYATPAIWNFNGLDGTTAGQAFSVSADGTIIFGISPKSVATGPTNYGYKAVFDATMPGPATQMSVAQLPNFPDTVGSTDLAVPYGCTPDGQYAVGMSFRGVERAVLWDTSDPNPAGWRVVDLTEVAVANGMLDGFARLSRAYSVGTDASGALVIAGAGSDTSTPANTRAFLMTVSPPIAPIAFPPIITTFSLSPDGFTCSFLSLANPEITYYLEATTNLVPPSAWTPISSTPGTGGMTSLSDANPPGQQRFYRIRIQ